MPGMKITDVQPVPLAIPYRPMDPSSPWTDGDAIRRHPYTAGAARPFTTHSR